MERAQSAVGGVNVGHRNPFVAGSNHVVGLKRQRKAAERPIEGYEGAMRGAMRGAKIGDEETTANRSSSNRRRCVGVVLQLEWK